MVPHQRHRTTSDRFGVVAAVAAGLLTIGARSEAQTGANVLVVINTASRASETIGRQYAAQRDVPQDNLCAIQAQVSQTISRNGYSAQIEQPIWMCISTKQGHDRILYIVLTKDVPIRIAGTDGRTGTASSVDSELTLLYRQRSGRKTAVTGFVPNPYFAETAPIASLKPFSHETQDIYLVTRLDGDTVDDALALITRGSAATADGRFVFNAQGAGADPVPGRWFGAAAERLTSQGLGDRVVLDGASTPATGDSRVLGYYGWTWSKPNRAQSSAVEFPPGALAGLFVSTSPSLLGDLVSAGLTGASVNVDEPYLDATVRPDILFPAYASGRNLAESFYAAMPYLSWQTVVLGDPLCAPFPHASLPPAQIDPPLDAATELPAFFAPRVISTLVQTISRDAATAFTRFQSRILRNDSVGARQDLEAAIATDPSFSSARMQLALLADRAGDPDQAIAQYRAILSLTANDSYALNNLAYILAVSRNDPQQALPFAERAVQVARLDPKQLGMRVLANYSMLGYEPELLLPYSLDTLAWVQHLLGRHTDAAITIGEARSSGGESPAILWHAAVIYASVNDVPHAVAELNAALASDPLLETRADVQKLHRELSAILAAK
jgi:uncharacterized protein (TIGR03790 family)